MASVSEIYTSRIGGVAGLSGTHGLTTTHLVTLDSVTDDPRTVITTGSVSGSVYIGKPYPWGGFGVVAFDYVIVDRKSPLVWEVDVLYRVPLFVNARGQGVWDWEWNVGLASERVFFSLPGIPARGATAEERELARTPQPIGPNVYSVLEGPPDPNGGFYVDTINGRIDLQRTSEVRLIGIDVPRPVASLSLNRVFGYIPPDVVTVVNTKVGFVNNDAKFYGAGRRTLRFAGAVTRKQSAAFMPNQVTSGQAFEVFLGFDHDDRGHSPKPITHTWRTADGETAIRRVDTGEIETTSFKVADETPFASLLTAFD